MNTILLHGSGPSEPRLIRATVDIEPWIARERHTRVPNIPPYILDERGPPYVSCLRNGARGNAFEEQGWSCATAIIAGPSSRVTGLRSNSFDSKSCRWKTTKHVSEPRSVPKQRDIANKFYLHGLQTASPSLY
ncbi:hypothetical protein N7501_009555 [Penicillium viridicatum]|nr:hypothetical protein N7501_009555 [Penicillium viridicatum]